MNFLRVTAPIREPVDLSAMKLHLRIEPESAADDSLVASLITTAREHVEDITRRAILTQTWDYSLDCWPSGTFIKLPFGNLQSVTSLKWTDSAGAVTTLAVTTDYLVQANGEQCGRIVLPYAGVWPSGTLYPSNPITARFICGWTSADLVPFRVKAAMKLICAKLYEGRGEDVTGLTVHEDTAARNLLESLRLRDEF